MGWKTLAQMILDRAAESPDQEALRYKKGDRYVGILWKDAFARIERIAAGLLTATDVPHHAAITIIGNTSVDWVLCDCACLSLGLRTVPIYASLLPPEVGYLHTDTEAIVAIAEDKAQLEKLRACRDGFEFFEERYEADRVKIRHIVVIDPAGLEPADDWESLADLEERGRESLEAMREERKERVSKLKRDDVATYTYTSGTTGPPKGVIQTHGNMLSLLENVSDYNIFNDERVLDAGLFLFLPLAHSFGRLIELGGIFYGAPIIIAAIPTLADDLKLSRPGFLPAAPRVYEKVKSKLDSAVADAPPVRQKLFAWAMDVGRKTIAFRAESQPLPFFLGLQHKLADKLVLSKLRARLGLDRCIALLTGSAPISVEVHEFFLAMGLDLLEAYGLTETCPGLTMNRPGHFRLGSVGQPIEGVDLKIAADGEIIARGPNITSGYLNRPEATAEAFEDGWFHTGDLGKIDDDGYVYITGRKKELIKTSGGKYVAPAKIEGRIKNDSLVSECLVVGDRRNYCVALIAIDPDTLKEWADRTGNPADVTSDAIFEHVRGVVDGVNKDLASFETLKYFKILPEPLTVENGLLTASLKVKRKPVEERYESLIDEMYKGDRG
jgi:long-chain acyl-CoA synthetase